MVTQNQYVRNFSVMRKMESRDDSTASSATYSNFLMELWACYVALELTRQLGVRFNWRSHLSDVLELCADHLVWPENVLLHARSFYEQRLISATPQDQLDTIAVPDDLQDFVDQCVYWSNAYDDGSWFYYVDDFTKCYPRDLFSVFQNTHRLLEKKLFQYPELPLQKNLTFLAEMLGLKAHEKKLLFYAALVKYNRNLRTIFVDAKTSNGQESYVVLGDMLSVDAKIVKQAVSAGSRLDRLGLIDEPISENAITDMSDVLRISEPLLNILLGDYSTIQEMMAMFTHPVMATNLQSEDFSHLGADLQYLIAFLKQAHLRAERGVNVLVYGAPGTGKTELAKLLAKESGCDLYAVEYQGKNGESLSGRDRFRALSVSQAFLSANPNALILFDEVEDVFPHNNKQFMSLLGEHQSKHSIEGKAWVNQILETNTTPVIWIANAIDQIDEAFLRRFQYHLQIKNPPPQIRESMVKKYLQDFDLKNDFLKRIAARPNLSPAQIHSVAKFAALVKNELDIDAEFLIQRQLDNADAAMGRSVSGPAKRPTSTDYQLEYLNLETRYPIERVINALGARQRGTLCFYGPPGTGKTALAEHISAVLQKPLLIKRASDVLSKYVGETEQKIAAMFAEAESDNAILLLDEADSMMQNRQFAVRNFEVSEVNEMLQGMERFSGIFICTTNLFDRIDEAALRRFNFKIAFKPLTYEQRTKLFVAEALGGQVTLLTKDIAQQLAQLEGLTPGDYATVKQQALILGEPFSPEEFVQLLEQEFKAKRHGQTTKGIGFLLQ